MKKTAQILALITIASACSTTKNLVNEANRHYENLEYNTAVLQYTEYLKTKKDPKAEISLAECYYYMNHFSDAEKTYASVTSYSEISAKNMLQYAHVLKHNGKYKEAGKWFVEYLLDVPTDAAVMNELRSCDSLANYTRFSYEYKVSDPGFNSGGSNFSPVLYKNGIVFCSERSKPEKDSEIFQWTGRSYLDLYYAQITPEILAPVAEIEKKTGPMENLSINKPAGFSEPVPFAKEINSAYNEGPACFTKDGHTIYFTRNVLTKNKKPETNKEFVNNFEIYKSMFINNVWTTPQLLSIDNKEYSVGHPALSNDGKRLYFISDKPGGFGGTDLYYSVLTFGNWSEPVNAGPEINTQENEMFPVIYVDEKEREFLYFSSEGHPGMGGLDIYSSEIKSGSFSKPVHLNAPLNSFADDFGIIFSGNGTTGFFSTNRDMADGTDQVLAFEKYIPQYYLEISVSKKGTNESLPDTKVDVSDLSHNKKDDLLTDAHGKIFMKIDQNSELLVNAKKENFFSASANINNIGEIFSDTLKLALELDAIVIDKAVRLDDIHYDFNKWEIRTDATPSLDKLVKLLKENPAINIELGSHTDSRGSDTYNMTLSQKRAESAVKYIISQNISAKRISAKGYGESKLLNSCKNGVNCSEEEHQLNRRTEFKVVKLTPEKPNKINP